MKITLGSIITSASGRLGGNICAMSKGSCTIRNRGRKTTFFKGNYLMRAKYNHNIVVAWRNMSVANRLKWFEYAKTFFNDFKGKGTGSMSAYSVFTMLSRYRYNYSLTINLVPYKYARYSVPVISSYTYSIADSVLSIVFAKLMSNLSGIIVYASRPCLASVLSSPNQYRFVKAFDISAVSTINLKSYYLSAYGSLGFPGSCIFIKIIAFGKFSGIPSEPVYIRLNSVS